MEHNANASEMAAVLHKESDWPLGVVVKAVASRDGLFGKTKER